ncbi:MAG: hypothetical protein H0T77_05475 [Pyrinomonadaceae bacterium]|nr:hypothetical protein [Pyrinomonadaceae bacterium]
MKRIIFICSCLLLLQSASLLLKRQNSSLAKPHSVSTPNSSTLDHGGKIETKYDGFNYETVVTLKKMRITCGGAKGLQSTIEQTCVSLVASLHCPGVQLDHVRLARLQLIFETKDWDKRHPLGERELFVVADGQRLRLGRMGLVTQNVAGDRGIDVMKEVLEVAVPYQAFNKIARSQTIEIRLGKTVFALQEKNLEALRDLNNRVKF